MCRFCVESVPSVSRIWYIYSCTWYSAWSGLDPHQLSLRKGMQVDPMKHTNRCSIHRCESFNSLIRGQNIHGNKQAPSRDIAHRFAVIEHLRFLCNTKGYANHFTTPNTKQREVCIFFRSGKALQALMETPLIKKYYAWEPAERVKRIYQPGVLHKV